MLKHKQLFGAEAVTEAYLSRRVDSRMVNIIGRHLRGCTSVLDVACGSGLYGPYLKGVVPRVFGIDHDPILCDKARSSGAYDDVVAGNAQDCGAHFSAVDAVFCSEFLEHVPDDKLTGVVAALEAITASRIVITVPNPLSPHYKHDPTHIAHYNIYSMSRRLNSGSSFRYRLGALGFSDFNRRMRWAQMLNHVSTRIPLLSPTVLYIGERT